jgi:uncharacterized protein
VIFVDTGFFFALAAEDDPDHERVRAVFEELDPKRLSQLCITTNHVVFETITLTRASSGHREAVSMGRRLYKQVLARIHWATPGEEKRAFDYLVQHRDKGYSAVDCLSFAIMEQYGIQEALAIDSDFTHRFIARPGPAPK